MLLILCFYFSPNASVVASTNVSSVVDFDFVVSVSYLTDIAAVSIVAYITNVSAFIAVVYVYSLTYVAPFDDSDIVTNISTFTDDVTAAVLDYTSVAVAGDFPLTSCYSVDTLTAIDCVSAFTSIDGISNFLLIRDFSDFINISAFSNGCFFFYFIMYTHFWYNFCCLYFSSLLIVYVFMWHLLFHIPLYTNLLVKLF